MGKTGDLSKKTGETKGIFHVKMCTVKDRHGKDLTEAEEIKNTWEEYTEECTRKVLITWITTMVWSLTYSQTSWSMNICIHMLGLP